MDRRPLSQRRQVFLADASAPQEPNQDIRNITEQDQQIEGGHEQQENPGEECSGGYEERPERPASHYPRSIAAPTAAAGIPATITTVQTALGPNRPISGPILPDAGSGI